MEIKILRCDFPPQRAAKVICAGSAYQINPPVYGKIKLTKGTILIGCDGDFVKHYYFDPKEKSGSRVFRLPTLIDGTLRVGTEIFEGLWDTNPESINETHSMVNRLCNVWFEDGSFASAFEDEVRKKLLPLGFYLVKNTFGTLVPESITCLPSAE